MARNNRKKSVDFYILIAAVALVFIGIIMVYSSSWPEGTVRYGDGFHYAKRHLMWAVVGICGMLVMMNLDYKIWRKYSLHIYILSVILGLLIFTPLGLELKGGRRWIDIGFTTLMPSDALKLGSIIFFAAFLDRKKDKVSSFVNGFIPAAGIIGFTAALIYFQKDLSTTITLLATLFSMYFVAGMHLSVIAIAGTGAYFFWQYAINSEGNEYRLRRILAFRDPFADKLGDGWQAVQSLYALGSGGLLGVGLGQSRQKFFYIPESYNDFIFSIIGEEIGLIGTIFVLSLYGLIVWRGVLTAMNARDTFGCYLATGITALLAIQSFINIGVVTSSIPATGITLPLISFGGTSLVTYLAGIGILLNITRYTDKNRRKTDEVDN
ncbi:MAG TPA: putative lipid II flippase FtsW [Tissierellales bacterium]|jgi:cell division protein FtsW|uniref:putative lipid II flippase FtsW n=1 Tax=Gudongella oleilytica TaxID=1582259 RepID=UPI000EBF04FA|nr:putative lipid II flippase FtsW [Gudongella oleilytica]MDY0255666.1 putative lipid II flippase FtsW [Gudongella oleilytica]HCO19420.1 putative lipid II flippase FtsW [Tissierellales bacterium]HMM69062.1 putative lipid II flippase FtsW [Gudongella oleilytica]